MDKEVRDEEINDLVINNNNGVYVYGTAVCANHVYGKYD